MKTAMEIAEGFDRGRHRNRAIHLVRHAKDEAVTDMLGELETIIHVDEGGGYADLPLRSVLKSWVLATRETMENTEEKEEVR